MRPFDALLFDLGGTLIYFDAPWPEALAQADVELARALRAGGIQVDEMLFLRTYRQQIEEYYKERETEFLEYTTYYILQKQLAAAGYPDVPLKVLRSALDRMYAVTQEHWQPEEDAVPVLQALQAQGYRMGIVSNAGDDMDVQSLIDKAHLRPYFESIVSSAAEGIRKPNPRIFRDLLDSWDVAPERAAMVGDTLGADILGARNAGLYSIWITRRADTPDNRAHVDTIRPDAAVSSLYELVELLERMNP